MLENENQSNEKVVATNPSSIIITIEKVIQSRFHSKGAWLATISFVTFILKTYWNYEVPHVNELVNYILMTATMFGVFNDPTSKNTM